MINFIFLSIPCTTTYEGLKRLQHFPEDTIGVSNWIMRFPMTLYSSDLKQKHIFRQGEVQVQPSNQISLQQKWKYFIMTNQHGNRYYCTSQMFYEKGSLLQKSQSIFSTVNETYVQFYIPKCMVIVSQLPYFKLHVNLLKVHRELRKKMPSISSSVNEQLYNIYISLVKQKKQIEFDHIQINPSKLRSIECPIQMVFDYYIENCNTHNGGQSLYIEKQTNREVLHLYKLNPQTLYQITHYFHLPLSSKSIMIVLAAIFQQKQIIFISNNQNLNVMLIQTLMQMILPFKWYYMYVPNLPFDMLEAAEESFMPYIVGIQKKYQSQISYNERVIIDVDTDTVSVNTQLNYFPPHYEIFFKYNTTNKSYLQWERQIRINSTLFISEMLSQSSQYDSMLRLTKDQKNYFVSNIIPNVLRGFYDDFLNKSMMFQKFIEDKHLALYHELTYLLSMNVQNRRYYLLNKFDIIMSQVQSPNIIDNEKQWIRFYHRHSSHRRNKYYLNSKSISINEMYRSSVLHRNQIYYTNINNNNDSTTVDTKTSFNKSTIMI